MTARGGLLAVTHVKSDVGMLHPGRWRPEDVGNVELDAGKQLNIHKNCFVAGCHHEMRRKEPLSVRQSV
jgi:hypothetical protein